MTGDPFEHPFRVASTDGVEVAGYDLGGDGPDVLCAHATGFCAGVWGPMAAGLEGHVRAVDLRGHGRTALPPGVGMAWSGTAADVLAVVDGRGLRRPVGLGHSMGGASLLLAEAARPGTFAGLWLFEPIVFPPSFREGSGGPNPLVEGARRRRPTFPSAEDAVAHYASKPPLDQLRADALEAYVRHGFEELPDGSVTLRCRPEVEAATFEMGPQHEGWDLLGRIGCPVTVVRGHADAGPPAGLAPAIVERLPHGRLEEHPELGHFGPLEDPDVMAVSANSVIRAVTGAA